MYFLKAMKITIWNCSPFRVNFTHVISWPAVLLDSKHLGSVKSPPMSQWSLKEEKATSRLMMLGLAI